MDCHKAPDIVRIKSGQSINTYTTSCTRGLVCQQYDYSPTIPHAATSVNRGSFTDSFSYDANGNMTCRTEKGVTYLQTYNAENRIASIQKLASGTCDAPGNLSGKWDFTYDGDGVRTGQSYTPYTNGTPGTAVITRYYFGGSLETQGSLVKKYYFFAGQIVAMKEGAELKYFLTDHLGSIVAIMIPGTAGWSTIQQRYMPFGEVRTDIGSISQTDFGYTGQRKLDEGMGGIMDYKARFYSPYINRFLQPDSIIPDPASPQSWNRYSYVINNPLRYTDPTGHMQCEDYQASCLSEKQVTKIYKAKQEKIKEKSKNKNNSEPSDLAAMATVLDTVAAGLNGGYAIVGDIVMLTCPQCELAVVGGYQYYSYLPNSISTLSMGLWFMDGVNTGENDLRITQTSQGTNVSVSISQDTLLAAGTNLAGWTILREPNSAFLVDAGVAGYDYARMGMIPFVDYTVPAFINPTVRYNTSTGFDFSWHK